MMSGFWLSLVLLGCLGTVYAVETCDAGEVDEKVYLFGYGNSFPPFEFLNDDGELMGLGFDITRSICKIMNKKCEHAVYYDYSYAYNSQGISTALNDGWYDALVNWVHTPMRLSSYSFSAAFLEESAAYMFVRSSSKLNTIDDIKSNANKFGFRTGFRTSPECLGKYLGMSLESKGRMYDNGEAMERGLRRGEVDVIFLDEAELHNPAIVKRVGAEPIRCASGGRSLMFRKDKAGQFGWFDEGFAKLRASGDYDWLCNMVTDVDPGCFDD